VIKNKNLNLKNAFFKYIFGMHGFLNKKTVCPFQNCVRQPHPPFKMAAVFKGNDYLPLKFASVSFYCQASDTGSVG
jgi:hypothetical protein